MTVNLTIVRVIGSKCGATLVCLFSIIIIDFEGSVSRSDFRRNIESLINQTCFDFEVLVYHDGPKETEYSEDLSGLVLPFKIRFFSTQERENDWGHSNRDRGIREAEGKWIIHTNADNVFYSNLISTLKLAAIDNGPCFTQRPSLPLLIKSIARRVDVIFGTDFRRSRTVVAAPQILIYAIRMQGMLAAGSRCMRKPELAGIVSLIWGGVPVSVGTIDAMQFVMLRDIWLNEGGVV